MAIVTGLIRRKWGPEQIAGELAKRGRLGIRRETINRRIHWDKKAGRELWRHTRIIGKFGRTRYRSVDCRGFLPARARSPSVPRSRDAEAIGHWDGDTVMGSDERHCVLTLVERKTGFAILENLNSAQRAGSQPAGNASPPSPPSKLQVSHDR
jgi:IS30 family transposase